MHTPLPVRAHCKEIVDVVGHSRFTVIAGETGSGKTSGVPRILLDAGFAEQGLIACSQPRRIATMSVSGYAARCHGTPLGSVIGYQIRHENMTSGATRIKYATEGILLREMRTDPLLRKYAVIIIDEVHERGVNQDVLLALLPGIVAQRSDLKVVLMSATMDEERIAAAFNAPIIRIKGRMYPVRIEYVGAKKDVASHAADVTVDHALRETDGDVLIFMPDLRHIRATIAALNKRSPDIAIHALYGNQSPAEQRAVLERTGRSVIVATNIAETSLTLEGLTAVVDSGLVKEMSYNPAWAASTFRVVPHAQNGCTQRGGRAGRLGPGVCYRLYDEADFLARPVSSVPEILRTSLEPVLLSFKGIGLSDEKIPPRSHSWTRRIQASGLMRATVWCSCADSPRTDASPRMASV